MKDFFKDIFEYHHHFNQQLADLLISHQAQVLPGTHKLFSHSLNAQQVWNARITGKQSFDVWQTNDPENYKAIDLDNFNNALYIIGHVDLEKSITYKNSKGDEFSNLVKDILFHVNNHSTYHRAQIASQLRSVGIKPLITDFIFYKRES